MGFCCKILCLNDLTPSPISRPGTHCLQWQWANARANLWWRHEPFPDETNIALRPCQLQYWKGVGRKKRLGDAWVLFHLTDVVNLAWYVRFWKKFTFNRAQHVVRKPLVYSADCGACWSQVAIPILHVKYRAQFLLWVGWGGMSYWVYVTLSCHNWKRSDFRYSGAYFIY